MNERTWNTIPEAAEYLRCSERFIRELVTKREITPRKVGGKFLVHRDELDAYADAQPSAWAAS